MESELILLKETAATSSESEAESDESEDEETTTKEETKPQASTTVQKPSPAKLSVKTAASPTPIKKKLTLTIHILEVLYNPTNFASFTTASPTNNFGFKFSFGGAFPGDNDDSDRNVPTAVTPYKDPRHCNRQQTVLQSNRGSSSEASFM